MKRLLFILVLIAAMPGCKVRYAFNDTSIPVDVTTASVSGFTLDAPLAKPTFSQQITEGLKDVIQSQSKLTLVPRDGDVQFNGSVISYNVAPVAVQGGETSQASLNRLTVSVRVQFINTKKEEQNYENVFTKYADFSAGQNLAAVESQLLQEITQQLVQDIFNKAFSQW